MPVPQQLEAFRQAREDTLQLVAPLSQEQLDRSPAPTLDRCLPIGQP
jgi:hypothetical protein